MSTITRRRLDAGHIGITRPQLEYLIDEALGQASRTQEQILTREQAERIIAQRLKDSGQATMVRSQLEHLINNLLQKDIDRMMNEVIQESQEQPMADQARPAVQVTPPNRPRPRRSPTRDLDDGDAGRDNPPVTSWIPAVDIDYDVINESITLFMGHNATVTCGTLANVRHTTPTL